MIDPRDIENLEFEIGDDLAAEPHDTREPDGPDLDWFDSPMLPRSDMLAVIERHKVLDGRGINLFRNALERQPRSDLLDQYIGPSLYQPGSHYIYTTPDPNRYRYKNWHPEVTAAAIECQTIAVCGLFSNPLAWIDEADLSPGERTYNAGFTIYTNEFDSLPLDDQLGIIWSGRLKRIDAELRRYRDYRGYEVVYSGGKSLHFHFCFDLRHLKRALSVAGNSSYRDNWSRDLPDCLLRAAYAANWDRLASVFCDIAGIDRNQFPPDPSLQWWEQLRRCPWALRQVRGAHPLGLPSGYRITQPVLASDIFQNAKRNSTEWFHDPDRLGELSRGEQVRRQKTFIQQDFTVSSGELELFERHAAVMFRQIIGTEYPKFAHYEVNETGLKCFFHNDLCDKKPSSFCEGNRSRISLQGRYGFDADGVVLSATPNQIFDWIVSNHRVVGDPPADDWIMRRYKAAVHDRASLTAFMEDHLGDIVGSETYPRVLIRGPQGCGKSTKTMTKLPAIYTNDRGVIAFSSPSIAQAEEKIETFERVNQDDRFVPFLYLSLTALYGMFCPPDERITHLDVLEEGGSSWLHAIHERQPYVYERMCAYRSRLFDLRDSGRIPVLFVTHETLRQHANENTTRIFYARDFGDRWFEPMPKDQRITWKLHLLRQNDFHRVIVDEVTAHDLVSIHTDEVVEWVHGCKIAIGFEQTEDSAERYAKFIAHLSEHPCPGMTWNLLLDVLGCEYTPEHLVEVSGGEVPFDDTRGIYAAMVGDRYYVRPRGWWNQFWRVTLLTTEAVPTRIIEKIEKEAASRGELQDDRFKIYEFGLPASSHDVVTIELHRACKKKTLAALVRAYRDAYPDAEIISDMVKNRISEFSVTTHLSAKGSNAYIGSDIVAFSNALSPALFGELGALNTRFSRSDLVRLFYVDRFEQTSGRNRGFRGEQRRAHRAVFPPRLHNWLSPAMLGASYVGFHVKTSVGVSNETDEPANLQELEVRLLSSACADEGRQ
jgi:hypothetical protein